jgi:hypothetical protein
MPRGKHPESKEKEAPSVCVWETALHSKNAQQVDAVLPGPFALCHAVTLGIN